MRINDYDTFGAAYSAENETSLINAHYTRPAILTLAGDVTNRKILDAACGSGPLTAALRDRGATVTGFDSSTTMLDLARHRLGPDVPLDLLDISAPLPYPTNEFDDAIAALVLHYLQDWTTPLAELHRILKPGGRLIIAVNHPIIYKLLNPNADYFATTQWTDEYDFNGHKATLTYWHHPLHAMTDAFTQAGFTTTTISEPPPTPEAKTLFPDALQDKDAFLCFIFFVLTAT